MRAGAGAASEVGASFDLKMSSRRARYVRVAAAQVLWDERASLEMVL